MEKRELVQRFVVWPSVMMSVLLVLPSAPGFCRTVDYGRDIRPILADRCFACHGPDKEKREADLRLDERAVAVAQKAIVPGDAAASPLIARVTSQDEDEKMPPLDSHKKPLTADEIQLFQQWIKEGAVYGDHWSYAKLVRPPAPPVKDKSWPLNPVDQFIAATLEAKNLTPSAEADRRTLIRRLSFDLTGLPPSRQRVIRFLAEDSLDKAYAELVDELLQSDQFGERMALYWLDLVRFADTGGYHSDNHRDVAAYRDYVIHSFNSNKPFDQFTLEQLAGDLLPAATIEQKIGSAYNRLLQTTEEGGAQRKEYLAIYAADRVRNVSGVWLGTTLGCCQCHDHKYDPFSQRDFYSMAAFFADLRENVPGRQTPNLRVPTPAQAAQMEKLRASNRRGGGRPGSRFVPAEGRSGRSPVQWELALKKRPQDEDSAWRVVRPSALASSGGATLKLLDDLSVLSTEQNPAKDDYTIHLPSDGRQITGVRLEALRHPSLQQGGLSRGNGNFVLTQAELLTLDAAAESSGKDASQSDGAGAQPRKIAVAVADFEQSGYPVKNALDGKPGTGWAVSGHEKPADHVAIFWLQEPVSLKKGGQLIVRLRHQSGFANHNIGRFRLALTSRQQPDQPQQGLALDANRPPDSIVEILALPDSKRTPAQQQTLTKHYLSTAAESAPWRAQTEAWKKELAEREKSLPTMLVSEATAPREMRILSRGNWQDDSGEIVQPNTPLSLFPLRTESERRADRLDLARWIVSRENPLTARVLVNRLWYLMFGNGLSPSLDDVGHQGNWPSHPELLDWLAFELTESGWDVKHVLRLIVMSRTYRQTSTGDLPQGDLYNQWLTRQNRFRLDAEAIRDNALAVSGLLTREIGGMRSVKPYQPAGFWQHLNFPTRTYQADKGPDQYRRGVYTYWCRTFPHPSLTTFDAPGREECTAQRPRSNTPLQALVLLNDPAYVEAARVLAQNLLQQVQEDPPQRIRWLYQQVLSRQPNQEELAILQKVQQQQQNRYQQDEASAKKLLETGQAPVPDKMDPVELASWTAVARVILNLHETITRF